MRSPRKLALFLTSALCTPSILAAQTTSATSGSSGLGCASGTPNYATADGGFGVFNGKVYAPNGQPFVARGINLGPDDMSSATPDALQATFPGINFVRFATSYNYPGVSIAQQEAYINTQTARGIVVEVEDHAYPSPGTYTGAQLDAESAWYAQIAGDEKSNPYVWFGTMNEPNSGSYGAAEAAITTQEVATYQAIRNAGNNAPILMELYGGGNPGTIGAGAGMTVSSYASMTNIIWDLHYYGWAAGSNPVQTLQTEIQQAQTIPSADGTVPVIVGEYGNSTTGDGIDGNGQAVVQAVIDAGTQDGVGSAAWKWGSGGAGGGDALGDAGGLTSFGTAVAQFIKGSGAQGCAIAPTPIPTSVSAATTNTTTQTASKNSDTGAGGMTVAQVAALAAQGGIAGNGGRGGSGGASGVAQSGATPGGIMNASAGTTAAAIPMPGASSQPSATTLTQAAPTGTMATPAPASGTTSFTASDNGQTITPGTGNDTGTVTGAGNTIQATGGIQTISVTGSGNTITTGPYDDTIILSSGGNTINGGGGNDTVVLTYGGGTKVAANADLAAVVPLAGSGNTFVAPAPGTGTLVIQGTLSSADKIDLTQALAGTTWDHTPATFWNYVDAAARADGCTISVGGKVIVRLPGGSPGGQLGSFLTAE